MMKSINLFFAILFFTFVVSGSTVAYGSNIEPYKLYLQAGKAQGSASYRYTGTLETDTTIAIGGEGVSTKESIAIEAMGTGKGNYYAVSASEGEDAVIITESLMEKGTLYNRSFKEGTEKPKWTVTAEENLLQGDLLFNFQEYAFSKEAEGLTYSYGESKVINGIEHTQVIIGVGREFIQKNMSPMTEIITENIIGAIGEQLSVQEKAYMTALIGELYNNMLTDMKISCFINPRTSLFHSMTIDGLVQMNWLGMGIKSKTYGEFTFDYTTVTLPTIPEEDIMR